MHVYVRKLKRLRFKSINKSVQNANKDLLGSVKETVKKQLRQQLRSPQQLELAGVGFIEDTGTVGRNTTTPSPKPSNTQPSQNGSNKKPTEDKGTGNSRLPDHMLGKNDADPFRDIYGPGRLSHPEEWESIIKKTKEAGTEVRILDRDIIAYAPKGSIWSYK